MRRRVPKLHGRERKRVRGGRRRQQCIQNQFPITRCTRTHTRTRQELLLLRVLRLYSGQRDRERGGEGGERGLLKYAVACAQMKEAKNEVANDRQGELRAGSTGVPFSSGGQNDGLSIMHSISKIQNEFPVDAIELGTHTQTSTNGIWYAHMHMEYDMWGGPTSNNHFYKSFLRIMRVHGTFKLINYSGSP